MTKPRYIMIGGFLGAGKSTAVLKLAEHLLVRGVQVGLITNDQSIGLVDTAVAGAAGLAVEEIAGGCFCCRFDSLVEAANRLSAATRPDAFIAEPVGSCTDLVATVSYPLRRIYGDDYTIAPMSVMVDPVRAARILGLDHGKSFSKKVVYIYRKQLEEANAIVINKSDLLDADQTARLCDAIAREFPRAELFVVSARNGEGLDPWFEMITTHELQPGQVMDVDYDTYAEGEALLGWLNATVQLSSDQPFDGEAVMMDIAESIHRRLNDADHEIAHLKMTLLRAGGAQDVAVLNLVRNDFVPEMAQSLYDKLTEGQLIVNLRAEGPPELLRDATRSALARCTESRAVRAQVEHMESFRPGRPVPTHRMARPA